MGFSIRGLLIIIAIFIPNVFYFIFPPKNCPSETKDLSPIFTIFENIGRFSFFIVLPLSKSNFIDGNIDIWFYLMLISIVAYYLLWIRYAVSERTFACLFKPLWNIPVPMAIFPVFAFLFASLWGQSIYLGIISIIFAIGHISNSYYSYKKSKQLKP